MTENQLAFKAQMHHENVTKTFSKNLISTYIFGPDFKVRYAKNKVIPKVGCYFGTTVEALYNIEKEDNYNIVLNFASFYHPGGGFINGSLAQEEDLCHNSNLYEILSLHKKFYEENTKMKNDGYYYNRCIFAENVTFDNSINKYGTGVITCAAPNWKAISSKNNTKEAKNKNLIALQERCQFIIDIAHLFNPDNLILGAFGCGVFQQDPENVAKAFKTAIEKHPNISNIIFAIPDTPKYEIFSKIIG
jgi:uncharacterized protein (TIGR02452 family)